MSQFRDPKSGADAIDLDRACERINELLAENQRLRNGLDQAKELAEVRWEQFLKSEKRLEELALGKSGYIGFLEEQVGKLIAERDELRRGLHPDPIAARAGLRSPDVDSLPHPTA